MQTLTTGDIAKYCDVNQRTVIRWLDKGVLKGFKLPGRGNNRVKVEDFIRFLKDNGMPIPEDLASFGAYKVLIVDDERPVASAIQRALRPLQLDLQIAGSGFEAGSQSTLFKPDLMTLDLSMPGMDGYDVIRYVRETPELHDIKILVISALDDDARDKALKMGADGALSKPFDNQQLRESVTALLAITL